MVLLGGLVLLGGRFYQGVGFIRGLVLLGGCFSTFLPLHPSVYLVMSSSLLVQVIFEERHESLSVKQTKRYGRRGDNGQGA